LRPRAGWGWGRPKRREEKRWTSYLTGGRNRIRSEGGIGGGREGGRGGGGGGGVRVRRVVAVVAVVAAVAAVAAAAATAAIAVAVKTRGRGRWGLERRSRRRGSEIGRRRREKKGRDKSGNIQVVVP